MVPDVVDADHAWRTCASSILAYSSSFRRRFTVTKIRDVRLANAVIEKYMVPPVFEP
jgi:hypothetical protein